MTKDEMRQRLLGLVHMGREESSGGVSELRAYLTASIPTRSSAEGALEADGSEGGTMATDGARLLREQLARLDQSIGELRQTSQRQLESVDENTRATLLNRGQGAALSAVTAAGQAGRALTGAGRGVTVSPLIGGLLKLLGGKKDGEPEALHLYAPPSPIRLDAAVSKAETAGLEEVSYGQDGLPRRNGSRWGGGPPPVTIQVQTIDSRSFLDHSESIARAVREAMLNMHSLNDVITDL